MGYFKQRLSQIENRLQALIEGSAARLFPNQQGTTDLAARLVSAMHDGLRQGEADQTLAPNLYLLHLPSPEAEFFQANPLLISELAQSLRDAGVEAGLEFSGPLVIRVVPDQELRQGAMLVNAKHSQDELMQTAAVTVEQLETLEVLPDEAFLIVDGTHVHPLHQVVLNIGRRADNDLVIDDSRVSRLHAQVRWVRGQYVLFDLGSTGGTTLNGERVNQCVLHPGDVISLAGVPLVFGAEQPASDQTQDLTLHDVEPEEL